MPVDVLHQPVHVPRQLGCQAARADATFADDRDQPSTTVAPRGMQLVFEKPELVLSSYKRGLESGSLTTATPLRDDSDGAERRNRCRLPLQVLLTQWLTGDCVLNDAER